LRVSICINYLEFFNMGDLSARHHLLTYLKMFL
jgi:hypothetical protein